MRKGNGLHKKTPLKAKKTLSSRSDLKKAKPKLKTVSWYKKQADKYHSLATRFRFATKKADEWYAKCLTCPNYKPIKELQCGHFISRSHNITRYSEENTGPQCYGCNVMHQGRQYEFGKQIDLLYGAGTAEKLYQQSKQTHQFKKEELIAIIEYSKEQIKHYEST